MIMGTRLSICRSSHGWPIRSETVWNEAAHPSPKNRGGGEGMTMKLLTCCTVYLMQIGCRTSTREGSEGRGNCWKFINSSAPRWNRVGFLSLVLVWRQTTRRCGEVTFRAIELIPERSRMPACESQRLLGTICCSEGRMEGAVRHFEALSQSLPHSTGTINCFGFIVLWCFCFLINASLTVHTLVSNKPTCMQSRTHIPLVARWN